MCIICLHESGSCYFLIIHVFQSVQVTNEYSDHVTSTMGRCCVGRSPCFPFPCLVQVTELLICCLWPCVGRGQRFAALAGRRSDFTRVTKSCWELLTCEHQSSSAAAPNTWTSSPMSQHSFCPSLTSADTRPSIDQTSAFTGFLIGTLLSAAASCSCGFSGWELLVL